ncbi:MAG: DUF2254 domain-containing protein [Planctomycetes bacterium]|nr:DUF2254 domain-containing protein [Planctomycetota bacterium]
MNGTRLHKLWDQLTSSYWFVPMLVTAAMVGAGFALVAVDRAYGPDALPSWIDASQPDSARALLATIASASITIASLTFSITIVALTLATSTFGSRLLYNFMRSRVNQFVLGGFVGIYAYCLTVMQSVRSLAGASFVPNVAVQTAVVLAIAGIGVLVFFIHHISQSIQATSVVSTVSADLRQSIDRFFSPERAPEEAVEERLRGDVPELRDDTQTIHADRGGILQVVDAQSLVALAREHETCLHLVRRPGDYVVEGAALAHVGDGRELPDDAVARVRDQFVLGTRRTLVQDVEFALQQLVEIAVRALSPGINDPFTACSCIDELTTGLARIMTKGTLTRLLHDDDGTLRVVLDVTDFDGLSNAAFDQIRQHARDGVAVRIKLLESLTELGLLATRTTQLDSLARHARAVFDDEDRDDLRAPDLRELRDRRQRLDAAIDRRRRQLAG